MAKSDMLKKLVPSSPLASSFYARNGVSVIITRDGPDSYVGASANFRFMNVEGESKAFDVDLAALIQVAEIAKMATGVTPCALHGMVDAAGAKSYGCSECRAEIQQEASERIAEGAAREEDD